MTKYDLDNKEEWERVWDYHKETDNLFHRRFSFFLVAESMLIVSFTTILISTVNIPNSVKFFIPFLGIVYTFGWWYVNLRLRIRMDKLKEKHLKIIDPLYRKYMDYAIEPKIGVGAVGLGQRLDLIRFEPGEL